MKNIEIRAFFAPALAWAVAGVVAAAVAAGGCSGSDQTASERTEADLATTADTPVAGDRIQGVVQETMDAGGYTYVRVRTEDGDLWAAGPVTAVGVGAHVSLYTGMLMTDFRSETLDRTFERIYFVTSFNSEAKKSTTNQDMADALKRMHGGKDVLAGETPGADETPAVGSRNVVERQVTGELDRAPGEATVAEIYAAREKLRGKVVRVRGVVVKFTKGVMGTNWLHLQDGSSDEYYDLTLTTDETVQVGDLVVLEGVLAVDKDFGAGYRYEVILQGAKLITD